MPDLDDQFDFSDHPTEISSSSERAPDERSQEDLLFEELREWMLKEGLPELRRIFQEKVDELAKSFSGEAIRMAESVEERYDTTMSAEEAAELQEFLKQDEHLRAKAEAEMRAVVEGRLIPEAELMARHEELRARRMELDREWELLSEIVAWENDSEEMMRFALENNQDVPPMTENAERLNEVYRKIQALDAEIAELPLMKSKTEEAITPKDGADPQSEPLFAPNTEERAEWLRAKAEAETDPDKKAEWTMKYLDEVHGSTEDAEEGSDENPILLTKRKVAPPEEGSDENPILLTKRKEGPAPKEQTDLPDFIDYTQIEEVEAEIARKKAERKSQETMQARVDRVLRGEEIIDRTETSEEPAPLRKDKSAEKKVSRETAPKNTTEVAPSENLLDHLVTPGSDDDIELPLPVEEEPAVESPHEQKKNPSDEKLRDHIIDRLEISPLARDLTDAGAEREARRWLSDYRKGKLGTEETPASKIASGENLKKRFADKASFVAYLKEEAVKDPKYQEIIEGIDALTPEDVEGILGGFRQAIDEGIRIIREGAKAEVKNAEDEEVLKTSDIPANQSSRESVATQETITTHSERHDENAKTFGELVLNLDKYLDQLLAKGIDLQRINKGRNSLLKALNEAEIISSAITKNIEDDHIRSNTLTAKFKKLMKKRHKTKSGRDRASKMKRTRKKQ